MATTSSVIIPRIRRALLWYIQKIAKLAKMLIIPSAGDANCWSGENVGRQQFTIYITQLPDRTFWSCATLSHPHPISRLTHCYQMSILPLPFCALNIRKADYFDNSNKYALLLSKRRLRRPSKRGDNGFVWRVPIFPMLLFFLDDTTISRVSPLNSFSHAATSAEMKMTALPEPQRNSTVET